MLCSFDVLLVLKFQFCTLAASIICMTYHSTNINYADPLVFSAKIFAWFTTYFLANSSSTFFIISLRSTGSEGKDEYKKTLRAIIRCFTCPDMYFEKVARQAIVGLGTDESSLTRVITTRRPAWRWTWSWSRRRTRRGTRWIVPSRRLRGHAPRTPGARMISPHVSHCRCPVLRSVVCGLIG